ncbi:MAG TPA: ATP-dependent helicase, partial [Candidatus Pacearchaeota archaeon]|nr:ATP-dependent helicase [Candidatus Pacearchaeota archaeon]
MFFKYGFFINIMTQDKIIESNAKRIRCIAGPGTGKTYSIKGRVRRLLEEDSLIGPKIFAVTYTRLAAEQLRNDLCKMGIAGADKINASTLHSFAFKILQKEQAIKALGRHPRPCFKTEMNVIYHDLSLDFENVRNVVKKINAHASMWARLQHEEPGWPDNDEDKKFNSKYLQWMNFHKCISIDELISLAVKYLRANPINDVENFDEIIVDEYQDLNKADQKFLDLLSKESRMLIIGDDDQSIYSFRYANPEGIREWYDNQSEEKEDIQLNLCRRCDGNILSLANNLIENNPERQKEPLLPLEEKKGIGKVEILQWETHGQETKGLAKGIKKIIDKMQLPEGEEILVLVPRKEFGTKLKEELNKLGIGDVGLKTSLDWNDKELGRGICLSLISEERGDLMALRYWLGLNNSTWHKEKYYILYKYCLNNKCLPQEVLNNEELCKTLRIQKTLYKRWCELKVEIDKLSGKSIEQKLDLLFPPRESTEKINKILKMIHEQQPRLSLKELLTEAIVSHTEEKDESKIKIMTFYGAKGLTSHTVIIGGLVNGIIPGNNSDKLEE